jgi:hypothetical protein
MHLLILKVVDQVVEQQLLVDHQQRLSIQPLQEQEELVLQIQLQGQIQHTLAVVVEETKHNP